MKRPLVEEVSGRRSLWLKKSLTEEASGRRGLWPKRPLAEEVFGRKGFWPTRSWPEMSFAERVTHWPNQLPAHKRNQSVHSYSRAVLQTNRLVTRRT